MFTTVTSGLRMIPASPILRNWVTWGGAQITTGDGTPLQFFSV